MNSLINALKSVVDALSHPPVLTGFVHEAETEINALVARVQALEAQVNTLIGAPGPSPQAEPVPEQPAEPAAPASEGASTANTETATA